MKCCWNMLLAVTVVGVISASANATTITVTSGANSGPGTLREALATLSAPGNTDTKIHITASLLNISSTLTYPDVDKQLVITASTGAVINYSGANDVALECNDRNGCDIEDLAILTGSLFILLPDTMEVSTDIRLDTVHVYNSDKTGILIDVDDAADGDLNIDFDNVITDGCGDNNRNDYAGPTGGAQDFPNGVLIYDDHSGDTLDFSANSCDFNDNRRAGIKVYRKNGDLDVLVLNSEAVDNRQDLLSDNGDGMQFEQDLNGDHTIVVNQCFFSNNSEDDLEIEELGNGLLLAGVTNTDFENGAIDESLAVIETGDGNLTCQVTNCNFYDPLADGIKIKEGGEGTYTVTVTNCHMIDDNGDGISAWTDGLQCEPDGDDTVTLTVKDCTLNDCRREGIQFEPVAGSNSGCSIKIENCEIMGCRTGIQVDAPAPAATGSWTMLIEDFGMPMTEILNYQGNTTDLQTTGTWVLQEIADDL